MCVCLTHGFLILALLSSQALWFVRSTNVVSLLTHEREAITADCVDNIYHGDVGLTTSAVYASVKRR